MTYTKEIVINKDIKTVFDKLTSPDFMSDWQETLVGQNKNEEGKWVYIYNQGGREMEIVENVQKKEKPSIYNVEYTANGVINIMNSTFESIDENTTKWTAENEFKFTNLMMKVIGFVFGGSFPKQTEKDMQAFKNAVESL